jgi:hypothetical protein
MSIGRDDLGKLLARLVSASAEERDEASSNVRDWAHLLDDVERRTMIRHLALVASAEEDRTARESALSAAAELSGPGAMTRGDVEPVFEIPLDDLDPSEREYVQAIRDDLAEADTFWNRESPVISDAVVAVKQELAGFHPGLRWQTAYVWPRSVFPYRARASVLQADGAESIELYVDIVLEGTRLHLASGLRDADGQSIAEGPAAHEPDDVGAGRKAWIHDQLVLVAEFIRGSARLLRDRLAE